MSYFETTAGPDKSRPDHEQHANQRQSLAYIRQELTEYRPDITDDGLREAVTEWLVEAQTRTTVSEDAEDHVSNRLAQLREKFPMFRTRKHADGGEAFPDRCEGCPHYGARCPVITDNDQIRRRERIMDSAESSSELKRRLRDYAIDNSCHVMQDALEEVSAEYEPLLRDGQLLLMAVEETVLFRDESEAVSRALAAAETIEREGLDADAHDASERTRAALDALADGGDDRAAGTDTETGGDA